MSSTISPLDRSGTQRRDARICLSSRDLCVGRVCLTSCRVGVVGCVQGVVLRCVVYDDRRPAPHRAPALPHLRRWHHARHSFQGESHVAEQGHSHESTHLTGPLFRHAARDVLVSQSIVGCVSLWQRVVMRPLQKFKLVAHLLLWPAWMLALPMWYVVVQPPITLKAASHVVRIEILLKRLSSRYLTPSCPSLLCAGGTGTPTTTWA